MKANRFLSFIASVAALSFATTACDDDKKEDLGAPQITLNSSEITVPSAGKDTTIQLIATRDWEAMTEEDWIAIVPRSGSASSKAVTIEINVKANTGRDREGKIEFTIGNLGSKTLIIKQEGNGSAKDLIVYKNDFDKEKAVKGTSGWKTYLDSFDGWRNETGTGISSVTYASNGITARTNDKYNSSSSASDYEGSGMNYLWFAKEPYFIVKKISLPASRNYTLSFGAERNEYSESGDIDNTFKHDEFKVYVSNDGSKWVEIKYSFPNGDKNKRWDLASSTFTVPEGTSTLYLYFMSTKASVYCFDDLTLSISDKEGTLIDFSKGVDLGTGGGETPEPGEMTISQALNAPKGTAAIVSGTVAATYQRGFIITDGTDYILVYDGKNCTAKENDNVKVTGTTDVYGGLVQLKSPEVTVVSSGNALTLPSPKVLDAAAFDAYSSSKIEYISYEGTLSVSGSYVNVEVAGATKHTGSLAYINDSFNAKSFDGAVVKVTGFYVGLVSNKYVNTMVTELVPSGSHYLTVGTTALSAAADATTATFDVKANVAWTVTSDNSAYTVEPASGNGNATITVKFAANTEDADKVVKFNVSTTADVTTKSYTVTLTHKGKGSSQGGDETTISIKDNNSWSEGTDATYGKGFEFTKDGVKYAYYKHKSKNDLVAPKTDHIRIYKDAVLSITPPAGKKIVNVVINCTFNDRCGDMTVLTDNNTVAKADPKGDKTVVWNGEVDVFVAQASTCQIQAKTITVVLK